MQRSFIHNVGLCIVLVSGFAGAVPLSFLPPTPSVTKPVVPTSSPGKRTSVVTAKKSADPPVASAVPHRLPVGVRILNVHTNEALYVNIDEAPPMELLSRLLRDRTSWEQRAIAPGTFVTMFTALHALGGTNVEIVSGYRSDKLNELLRKKGAHVAKQSEHVQANAVDFRIVGVPTQVLYRWALANHDGGVGFYPQSGFVHVDVGRKRTWKGE